MQVRLKAMKYYCECRTKIKGPLRLADYGFGPSRHTIDHINKEKVIKIMLEIAIFSAVAISENHHRQFWMLKSYSSGLHSSS